MHDFLAALLGGAMIGAAAIIVMASNGRVMGVSGIVSSLLPPFRKDWLTQNGWRLSFLGGVIAAPLIYLGAFGAPPVVEMSAGLTLLIASGLFVGVGTVIGSGCTSGHGVCGLARLSGRSLAATLIFMTTAIVTVLIIRTLGLGGLL
ncbi:MAG: YeeE/YedE family protein [Pseudomonadota bacterium]